MDKTQVGLLLLMVGTLLSVFSNVVGGVIVLVGALFIILGRKSFGDIHSRNTIVSVVIYIFGASVIYLGGLGFGLAVSAAASAYSPTFSPQSVGDAFQALLIATLVGGAIIGLAQVLFTYALQNQTGKALLWIGYLSSIAVGVLVVVLISPLVSGVESQTLTVPTYNSVGFASLQSQLVSISLVGFVPAVFFASAFYLARLRIQRKEIPESRPVQTSRLGSFLDDSRYILAIFARFMLPIVALGIFWLVAVIFYHY